MVKSKPTIRTTCISERVKRLSPSGIRRFFDLLASMDGIISLGVGEPDYPTPWNIRESAIYSIEQGVTMYTSNLGMPELRTDLSRYLKTNYKIDYDAESQLLITVGVSEALDLAMRAVINPGNEVIMPNPHYVAYDACVLLAGGVPVMVATNEKNGFEIGAGDIEARITDKTKAILLGYPANPTGAVMPKKKLEEIAALAQKYNLLVISDEIYARLVYGTEHTCVASLFGMLANTILLGGFSKSYSMTGWRVGYAAARADIIAAMTKIHQYTIMSAPTMGQVAAIEALKAGDASVTEMVEDYNRRRLVMINGLREIGLSCFEPKGAFYAFPSIKNTGMTSEQFAQRLLVEEKVAVVPGNAFGDCGEGHIRCCYATSLQEIEEALERINRFVGKYT
jgi:aminotransferase